MGTSLHNFVAGGLAGRREQEFMDRFIDSKPTLTSTTWAAVPAQGDPPTGRLLADGVELPAV